MVSQYYAVWNINADVLRMSSFWYDGQVRVKRKRNSHIDGYKVHFIINIELSEAHSVWYRTV